MNDGFRPGLIVGVILGSFVTGIVMQIRLSDLRREAIAIGAAHYVVVDTNSGKSEFLWITNGGAK